MPHGEQPVPEIPPDALAVTADLLRLVRREASEERREAGATCLLPPLLAALTRRNEDDARLRQLRGLRLPTPQLGVPPAPQHPSQRLLPWPSVAGPWVLPGRAFAEGVTLRLHPPLCCDAGEDTGLEDTGPDPLGVQELYQELGRGRALPAERLQFHCDPLVEPAAAVADLLPMGEREHQNAGEMPWHGGGRHGQQQSVCLFERQNAGEMPQHGDGWHRLRQSAYLFDDYLEFVAATGSDFLHAIFHLHDGDGEEEPVKAPQPRHETAPVPAEPYEKGLWKPVLPGPAPAGLERLQRRLCRLWAVLGVPSWERLEMAVKYGAVGALARLPAALEAWEAAADGILQRELLLVQLERLEERGSDPGRLFRGGLASATERAGEARARGRLHAALARCEARLSPALRRLRDSFGDTVTFRGRPYAEKMRRDMVEMLYQLQQRRRAGALQAALGGQPQHPPSGTAGAETPGC
ncbi:PREDICTED: coiled-coil domain-containing protein 87 [Haliaeetus leucocephalus]|uniref:coiled-coil domain-containing protein 87 n=1 Tax=Haliaeetus leucocephalus TaxID=52644 RepID=UPI00053CC93E|nr:PREDICTED: coiled-coil domain-containing protein 87 [Haliaeetus leucocephalus]